MQHADSLKEGEIVQGTVIKVNRDSVVVDIDARTATVTGAAEDTAVRAVDGCGPAGPQAVLEREIFESRPQRAVGDVEDGHGRVVKRRGSA